MEKQLSLLSKNSYKMMNEMNKTNLTVATMQSNRAVNVVGARETVGGPVVQQSGIQCFNCKEFGHYAKECRKPKRVKDSTYHKEKMLLCKQAEKGVQLQAEKSDWLADTNEEIDLLLVEECVFNANHDAWCLTKFLKDVMQEQEKPNDPIRTENPKSILVEKYVVPFHFGNDQFAPILGYGDLVQGNITIKRVYYVEGLNHNLFSVGQLCDADLEVAFWKSTCFVSYSLQGNDLLTGNCGTESFIKNTLQETTSSTPICLMAKASPTQADGENLDKMKDKGDPYILVGYSTQSKGYRVYNKRKPRYTVPSQQELDLLFGPLYDEFFNDGTSRVNKSFSPTDNSAPQDTLPSTNIHPTSEPSSPTNVNAEENNDYQAEFTNPFCTPVQEHVKSSSSNIGNSNVHTFNQPQDSEYRWTKDHPLTQVHGNPSKPVQTR
ncbi:integrase, catalytic region, zinc finger, CCHC-type containing protein [Tanacetum coccineum]